MDRKFFCISTMSNAPSIIQIDNRDRNRRVTTMMTFMFNDAAIPRIKFQELDELDFTDIVSGSNRITVIDVDHTGPYDPGVGEKSDYHYLRRYYGHYLRNLDDHSIIGFLDGFDDIFYLSRFVASHLKTFFEFPREWSWLSDCLGLRSNPRTFDQDAVEAYFQSLRRLEDE